MRKVIILGITVLAAIAVVTAVAIACNKDGSNAKTIDSENKLIKAGEYAKTGTCSKDASGKAALTADSNHDGWETRTIAIKGMTCAGCEQSISAALAEAPGVVEVVKVCHTSQEAVVKVDPAKSQEALLARAVTDKGYEAEIIPAVAKTAETAGNHPGCPMAGKTCTKGVCDTGSGASAHQASEKTLEGTK